MPKKRLSKQNINEIKNMYKSGMTIRSISEKVGVNWSAVFYHLKKEGIKTRPPGMIGRKHKEESKLKMSINHKGQIPWIKGRRMQQLSIDRLGSKNPMWKGGTSKARIAAKDLPEVRIWRRLVFERDNYTCQKCFSKRFYLNAHHKKSWAEYPNLRFDVNNGVTLCKYCHYTERSTNPNRIFI